MSSRIIPSLVRLTLIVALVSPAALAEGPFRLKPGARGQKCLECHATFDETMKLPHVHSPVAAGDCADCHNPHAATHSKLLSDDPNQICQNCHEDTVPEGALSVHEAVIEGGCVACHDPHAAENPNNLLLAGNELCSMCHDDIAEAAAEARFKHGPVEDSCLTCHDPHASTESEFLLATAVPELCETCHDSSSKIFTEQHMGYPVGASRCTSCHDPHGSENGAILWANVHPPIQNKMCAQCHNDSASADPLATKSEKIELCQGCHNKMVNETLLANRVHGPVVDQDACLTCHSPHASSEAYLLSKPTIALCGDCHQSTIQRQIDSFSPHPPVAEGECSSCHSPHSSNTEFLLAGETVIEVCSSCHDWEAHSSHPIGDDYVDPRNPNLTLDCASCHETHGTPHNSFTHAEPRRELCELCHADYRR